MVPIKNNFIVDFEMLYKSAIALIIHLIFYFISFIHSISFIAMDPLSS